jgi:hypothetical protein
MKMVGAGYTEVSQTHHETELRERVGHLRGSDGGGDVLGSTRHTTELS